MYRLANKICIESADYLILYGTYLYIFLLLSLLVFVVFYIDLESFHVCACTLVYFSIILKIKLILNKNTEINMHKIKEINWHTKDLSLFGGYWHSTKHLIIKRIYCEG